MLGNVLLILLGAGLVSAGFLGAALAERIRGHRVPCESAPREQPRREPRATSTQVDDSAEPRRPIAAPRTPRVPRAESGGAPPIEGGEDVVAALVAAGFKKSLATEATWACSLAERATIEVWTASALRRCVRGGMS